MTPLFFPKILRYNGFATASVGKWHMTDLAEVNAGGPTCRWPNMLGYDYFYGFMGGASSGFASVLWENMNQVSVGGPNENFDLGAHFAEKASNWLTEVHEMQPGKPTFLYFATGGVHTPHDLPREWRKKAKRLVPYFLRGWHAVRQDVIEAQKNAGIVPADLVEPAIPSEYLSWERCSEEEKLLYATQAATYATYIEKTDRDISRVVETALDINPENTLVLLLYGDNGSSAYGLQSGYQNWLQMVQGILNPSPRSMEAYISAWGSDETYSHFANSWCQVFDAPFVLTKGVTSNGGTRVGVAAWHASMAGSLQDTAYHHVIDIAPTILSFIGLPQPDEVNGIPQFRMQGLDFSYSLRRQVSSVNLDRRTQFFVMLANCSIYKDGYFARRILMLPWQQEASHVPVDLHSKEGWELFLPKDMALAKDVAVHHPKLLQHLISLFYEEATANYALPLNLKNMQKLQDAKTAGRPTVFADRSTITLRPYFQGLNDASMLDLKNGSWYLNATVDSFEPKGTGCIFSTGNHFNGFALYLIRGRPSFTYSTAGALTHTTGPMLSLTSQNGRAQVGVLFIYEVAEQKGGPASIYLLQGGRITSSSRITRSIGNRINVNDVTAVGRDLGQVMLPTLRQLAEDHVFTFPGKIQDVCIRQLSLSTALEVLQSLPSSESTQRAPLCKSVSIIAPLAVGAGLVALVAVIRAQSRHGLARISREMGGRT